MKRRANSYVLHTITYIAELISPTGSFSKPLKGSMIESPECGQQKVPERA